jgi:hypothetical protein
LRLGVFEFEFHGLLPSGAGFIWRAAGSIVQTSRRCVNFRRLCDTRR